MVRGARHVAVSGVESGEVSGARCTLLKPRARVVAAEAAAARKGGGGAHKPVSGIRLSVYVSAQHRRPVVCPMCSKSASCRTAGPRREGGREAPSSAWFTYSPVTEAGSKMAEACKEFGFTVGPRERASDTGLAGCRVTHTD